MINKRIKVQKTNYWNKLFNVFSFFIITFIFLAVVIAFFIQDKGQFSFLGYSVIVVPNNSMKNSFSSGDKVVIKLALNTDALRKGDIILFYQYADFCDLVLPPHTEITDIVDSYEEPEQNDDAEIFNQRTPLNEVQERNVNQVFHRITKIFVDEYGVRFFETKGDAYYTHDNILIREDYVCGKYIQTSGFIIGSLNFITSTTTITMTIFIILITTIGTIQIIKNLQAYAGEKTAKKLMKRKLSFDNHLLEEKKVYNYLTREEKLYLYDIAEEKDKEKVVNLFWGYLSNWELKKDQCRTIILLNKSFKLYKKDRNKFWDFWLNLETNKKEKRHLEILKIRADLILFNEEKDEEAQNKAIKLYKEEQKMKKGGSKWN
jgi:signal peptidase I